jgi:hypothetical protein
MFAGMAYNAFEYLYGIENLHIRDQLLGMYVACYVTWPFPYFHPRSVTSRGNGSAAGLPNLPAIHLNKCVIVLEDGP